MKRSRKKLLKFFAIFTVLTLLNEIAFPTVALALTEGPRSPEFSSFTPVATTNMVDLATGDFNYNLPVLEIPGTEGGGYALSLSYNSGVNSEQEASWVGFGWSLNPGAINRSLRGFPDDYNGEKVKLYNKARPNWSVTTGKYAGAEIFSIETKFGKNLRFNNYHGFMSVSNLSINAFGLGLGIDFDANGKTFSADINPSKMLSSLSDIAGDIQTIKANKAERNGAEKSLVESMRSKAKDSYEKAGRLGDNVSVLGFGGSYGLFTYSDACRANTYKKFEGVNVNFMLGFNTNVPVVPIGVALGDHGNINLQTGIYETNATAFGYFNQTNDQNAIKDYYVEKASDYSPRDVYIGMPFSNADIFGVTGEGVTGGFRGYTDKINNYNYATPGGNSSEVGIMNVALDISFGGNYGVGMSLGAGIQKNSMKSWSHIAWEETNPILRFNNDMGGKIMYGDSDTLEKADLQYEVDFPGITSVKLRDEMLDKTLNTNEAGSASYISYHTYSQINNSAENSFCKKINFLNNDDLEIPIGESAIMEYSIYNENGENYVYGVPVINRNETNLSFDIDLSNPAHEQVNHYMAFRPTPLSVNEEMKYEVKSGALRDDNNKTVLGEIRNSPYISAYLLSQITQPNYVDVNENGPDEADFGGWTKFSYRKVYGAFPEGNDNWYRYRTPYTGLHYSQNSISDPNDDLGSVTTGEKEVYYLETIETKTHIAFFVTSKFVDNNADYEIGNGSAVTDPAKARKDGMGAGDLSESEDPSAKSKSVGNELKKNELEYLERIVLFSKAQPEKPIKTIYFSYDYSLVPNVPNNENTSFSYSADQKTPGEETGKLTLKKVWFEYGGTYPAKISPYEFSYSYVKSNSIKTGNTFFEEYDNLSAEPGGAQNPMYAPEQLDPWGCVTPFGKERNRYDLPWRYQGKHPEYMQNTLRNSWRNEATEEYDFDPAAWHLKSIKLPSGGEIHIQYEEKDYCYVQDQPVLAMASLINNNNSYSNPWFDINVDDLGCDPDNPDEINALKHKIETFFAQNNGSDNSSGSYADKVYFKFLFDLTAGKPGSDPGLKNLNAEYITGYAGFDRVEIPTENPRAIRIYLLGDKYAPRQAAYDFYANQRQGLLEGGKGFGPLNYKKTFEGPFTDIAEGKLYGGVDIKDIVSVFWNVSKLVSTFNDVVQTNEKDDNTCGAMSNALSFIKLPVLKAKKGDGVRVKRLLLYDAGLENGDARLTGVQYHYVLDDGVTSSGVATNEPAGAREENPLVKYMIRKSQSEFSRLTVGEDKEQTEGPLGESLLPMAQVYHSRIVTENIHSDKVKTGFTVSEYFTTKDYPFDGNYNVKIRKNNTGGMEFSKHDVTGKGIEFTNLSNDSKKDNLPETPTPFFSYGVKKAWMAQGFRFIQNSMNGLLKRITVYGGEYQGEPSEDGKDTDRGYPVAITQHEYYEPGEKIAMIKPSVDGGFEQYFDTPGKEMEIVIEGKQLSEDNFSVDVSFDATVGIVGIIPILFLPIIPKIGINMDLIATHATTKVIRYPAILKSVTTNTDGVINRTEYQAFDAHTGKPVIVKAYDGYADLNLLMSNGSKPGEVYQFAMPASWRYPEMGPKSRSTSNANQLSAQTLTITSYGNAPSLSWIDGSDDPIANVLGVNVNTYAKNWSTSWSDAKIKDDFAISEDVIARLNAIWRPRAGYIYKTNENVDPSGNQVYDKGFFTIDNMFDWDAGASQANWVKVSEITKYSPHGQAIEEVDVMNIPSAAIYGPQYGNNLPVMIASNANYHDIYFNDFENAQNNASRAHSGKYSILYASQLTIVDDVYVTRHLKQKGGLLKMWMAFENGEDIPDEMTLHVGSGSVVLRKMASSGLWSLYESAVSGSLLPSVNSKADIKIDGYNGAGAAYIDDVRFQPSDAQAVCYVYDLKSLRLLAQFDDQHYGMYYKYNQEGALTHKMVETERGMKTIQETHYNTPKTLKQ